MTPFQKKINSLTKRGFLPEKPYQVKPRIKKEELEQLVIKLRKGDTTVINEIVETHLGLGIYIASRYGYLYPSKIDDLIGEMGVALVRSVWRAMTRLEDNNITPYISSFIHGELMKFIEEDRCTYMPGRTMRKYVSTGNPRLRRSPIQIPLINNETSEDPIEDNSLVVVIPETIDQSLLEVQECLDKSITGPIEKRVIELKAEGYTLEEIGPKVGYSKSSIQIIVTNVEKKFNKLFGA